MAKPATRYVIALDNINPNGPVFLADKPEWDGAWQTREIGNARTYARKGNALRVIASHGAAWFTYNARVEAVR